MFRKMKGQDYLEDLDVDDRIILKWIRWVVVDFV